MMIAEVKDVICHLKSGEVIGYPTEAVYGIGCDPWNQSSVEKIAKIKGRKNSQTFLMVASSPLTRSSYHASDDFKVMQNNRKNKLRSVQ